MKSNHVHTVLTSNLKILVPHKKVGAPLNIHPCLPWLDLFSSLCQKTYQGSSHHMHTPVSLWDDATLGPHCFPFPMSPSLLPRVCYTFTLLASYHQPHPTHHIGQHHPLLTWVLRLLGRSSHTRNSKLEKHSVASSISGWGLRKAQSQFCNCQESHKSYCTLLATFFTALVGVPSPAYYTCSSVTVEFLTYASQCCPT